MLALLIGRRVASAARRRRAVLVIAASYAALFFILLTQALGGESVIAPGPPTLAALAAWVTATAAGLVLVLAPGRNGSGARSMRAAASR